MFPTIGQNRNIRKGMIQQGQINKIHTCHLAYKETMNKILGATESLSVILQTRAHILTWVTVCNPEEQSTYTHTFTYQIKNSSSTSPSSLNLSDLSRSTSLKMKIASKNYTCGATKTINKYNSSIKLNLATICVRCHWIIFQVWMEMWRR